MQTVQQWGRYEYAKQLDSLNVDNPFINVVFGASVSMGDKKVRVPGFYDGDNVFRVRFMPGEAGEYTVTTFSNLKELDALTDTFTVTAPEQGNHGPVVVDGTHFRYADGSRFFVMGTTAYVWHHRPEDVRAQTLQSFTDYGFNKIRMLFFPKQYSGSYNKVDISYEPPCYPFVSEPCAFDFTRPNPEYFRQFEDRLEELSARDIQADVILFHPYDSGHWDIDHGMDEDNALAYVRYALARFGSFRNVWWSLANEYDVVVAEDRKSSHVGMERRDWDVIGSFIKARDPYHHPISCHNITFGIIYPNREWMSHVSYQHPDTYTLLGELLHSYNKPIVNDEYQYEGNLPDDWGNSSAEVVVERHWRSAMAGGYASHGESFIRNGNHKDIFWSYGGKMTGESAPRLRFMKEIIERCPFEQMVRDPINSDSQHYYALRKGIDFYLIFMRDGLDGKTLWAGDWGSSRRRNARYKATTYDVWNCKKISEQILPPSYRLPFTPWTAITLELVDDDEA